MKVRSDILRNYQAIHTWTGITAGLFLFIGFFAGALIMFKPVISDWATPPSAKLESVNLAQLDKLAQLTLQQYPDAQRHLIVNLETGQAPLTWLAKGSDRETLMEDTVWRATLNAQGELETQTSSNNELSYLIDMLHRTAGIAGEVGHDHAGVYVLGTASFLYFVALVSGVIFLLPTLAKRFFALRTKNGANRFWLDSHNLVGIASLPFHIVISITVVAFTFHDFFYDGLGKVYGDKPLFPNSAPTQVEYKLAEMPPISALINKVDKYAPTHQVKQIKLSGLNTPRAFAIVLLTDDSSMMVGPVADFVFMNPYTLEIDTSSIASGDQGVWGKLVSSFFALHFGSYGGEIGRWGYFTLGLLGAFLFYSGNLLWLEKRRQKNKKQTRSTRIMASLTVGVCLGSILGVAMCFAATKWLSAFSFSINNMYLALYYISFVCALGMSFNLGAAKAAILLLRLLGVICVMVPIASVISFISPELGLWPADSLASIMLELMCVLFAVAFFFAAQKTKWRAVNGEKGSVWAVDDAKQQLNADNMQTE